MQPDQVTEGEHRVITHPRTRAAYYSSVYSVDPVAWLGGQLVFQ